MTRPGSHRMAITAALVAGVVAGMVGLSFAAVPLYQAFCRITGYGGTTQTAQAAPEQAPAAPAEPKSYWYYCASAGAYYPTAPTCPEAWIKVPPRTE